MGQIKRYYYDKDCNKVENEEATDHDEIARGVIQNNPELLAEYEKIRKAGFVSESVFLVMKGYVYIGESNRNMSAMYSSISLSQKCKDKLIDLKQEEDCYLYDIIRNELSKEQLVQVKEWYEEGMTREQIADRIMIDMLVLLAPTKVEQANTENDFDER